MAKDKPTQNPPAPVAEANNEDNFQPGAVALQIMLQGEKVALGQLQARFKEASIF